MSQFGCKSYQCPGVCISEQFWEPIVWNDVKRPSSVIFWCPIKRGYHITHALTYTNTQHTLRRANWLLTSLLVCWKFLLNCLCKWVCSQNNYKSVVALCIILFIFLLVFVALRRVLQILCRPTMLSAVASQTQKWSGDRYLTLALGTQTCRTLAKGLMEWLCKYINIIWFLYVKLCLLK